MRAGRGSVTWETPARDCAIGRLPPRESVPHGAQEPTLVLAPLLVALLLGLCLFLRSLLSEALQLGAGVLQLSLCTTERGTVEVPDALHDLLLEVLCPFAYFLSP